MNTKTRWRATALVMAAVLVATSLSLLPRPAPVAAQQAAAPEEPAPLAKPFGKPVVEPVRGFVEGKSTEDRSLEDGTSAVLRSQVATQLRGFGAAAQGLENDAIIGATALERGIPLITGDRALWNAVLKLGGEARWFAPGM